MDITVISVLLLEFIVSNSKGTGMEIGTERIFVLLCRIFFVDTIVSILIRLLSVRASFLTN